LVGNGPAVSESVEVQEAEAVVTVNELVEVTVTPFTVTEIAPEVAPLGTVTTSCVAVADVTVAVTPLIVTVLSDTVVLKLVPVITIDEPTAPLEVKLVMVGDPVDVPVDVTVKSFVEVALRPFTVTVILPVVAPAGTVTVSCVTVAAVTAAVVPLKVTVLLVVTVLKLVPVMVTVLPAAPLVGVKLVIVGVKTCSSSLLHETMRGTISPDIPRLFKNCFLSIKYIIRVNS
jgi:hypothetical protein